MVCPVSLAGWGITRRHLKSSCLLSAPDKHCHQLHLLLTAIQQTHYQECITAANCFYITAVGKGSAWHTKAQHTYSELSQPDTSQMLTADNNFNKVTVPTLIARDDSQHQMQLKNPAVTAMQLLLFNRCYREVTEYVGYVNAFLHV